MLKERSLVSLSGFAAFLALPLERRSPQPMPAHPSCPAQEAQQDGLLCRSESPRKQLIEVELLWRADGNVDSLVQPSCWEAGHLARTPGLSALTAEMHSCAFGVQRR